VHIADGQADAIMAEEWASDMLDEEEEAFGHELLT